MDIDDIRIHEAVTGEQILPDYEPVCARCGGDEVVRKWSGRTHYDDPCPACVLGDEEPEA